MSEAAYHRARLASEKLRDSDLRAADHLTRALTDKADTDFAAGKITAGERDALHAATGDSRAALHRECGQWHLDQMAALQQHFGQPVNRHGDPETEAALCFAAEIDPTGEHRASAVATPTGQVVEINHNGIPHRRRVDGRGRVIAENPVADDGWSSRQTFTPADPDEFVAAKRAGIAEGGDR